MIARNYIIRGVAATAILIASARYATGKQQVMAPQTQVTTGPVVANEDKRSAKQKVLDEQAEKLVTMAGELKAAVDKTNKNILSLDVVRKAEDIEALAHKMKEQGKR